MSGRGKLAVPITFVFLGGLALAFWMGKESQPEIPVQAVGPQGLNLEYIGTGVPSEDCRVEATNCVDLQLLDTAIWRDRPDGGNADKPKKVRWFVDNDQKQTYYWEIEYKGNPGADYLESIDPIKCNKNKTKAKGIKKGSTLPDQYVEWIYEVRVFECVDGMKGGCYCKSDPRVGIRK